MYTQCTVSDVDEEPFTAHNGDAPLHIRRCSRRPTSCRRSVCRVAADGLARCALRKGERIGTGATAAAIILWILSLIVATIAQSLESTTLVHVGGEGKMGDGSNRRMIARVFQSSFPVMKIRRDERQHPTTRGRCHSLEVVGLVPAGPRESEHLS